MADQSENKAASESDKKDVLVTPEGEEIDLSIVGTMKIDPADYKSVSSNPNRLKSLKYAVAGMLYVLKREPSIQLATVITVIVVVVGLLLQVGAFSWALLTLALGAVWITECLNTAIEATIDLGSDAPHPMAKVGKDVASTASLVATIVFLIVCALILLPRIIDRFN
ncbi:MAG: diacylglycerol kinase family protein [Chitinophagaceae bacterium]|nr:diacylglycerol kinase family protein [Anaerolineae bacterium]